MVFEMRFGTYEASYDNLPRMLSQVDGTFFTGRYKGQILTAIGVDCNNQIVPLAFAFVENENLDSWYWFLERVKVHVVAARPDVWLISDRHTVCYNQ